MITAALFACTVLSVYDGDGPIHCRELGEGGRPVKIRLSGIAAREMDGTCRPNQPCPAASAQAAKQALSRLVLGKVLTCRREGMSYQRVVARCWINGVSVECAMIRSGTVLRWPEYDPTERLKQCK